MFWSVMMVPFVHCNQWHWPFCPIYIYLCLCVAKMGYFRQFTELFFVCFWYKLGCILCGVWLIGSAGVFFQKNNSISYMCIWVSYIIVNTSHGNICRRWGYSYGVGSSRYIRAGLQSQKWSDQQITLNPTGSIHEKARKKKVWPKKKLILMRGIALEKNGPCSWENEVKILKKRKMVKNHFSRSYFGS